MRVRPILSIGMATLIGASFLQTSTPADAEGANGTATVNLSPDRVEARDDPPPAVDGGMVWAITRAVTDQVEGAPDPSRPLFPDGIDAVAMRLTAGAGPEVEVLTNALTVSDLVAALGLRVNRLDVLRPPSESLVWAGIRVRLIRIREVVRTESEETPYQTLIQYSKDLALGTSRILEAGQVGRIDRTFRIRLRNGREIDRQLLFSEVVSDPVDQVVLEGTVEPSEEASHREAGEASWYDFCPVWGMYAAHKTIPTGTVVHVRNVDTGASVDVVINDHGPYVPGRIIDLCQPAFAAIAPLGQGVVDVEITW